ncbi:MAG: aminomethyltransferase beta-barrel domain-containing protein, partial [Pseudomonadota bacterium]
GYLEGKPGPITTPEGTRVGEHRGLIYYTLGQRNGLNIGGSATGTGEAWYVAAKSIPDNRLIVVQGQNHPALYAHNITVPNVHWISGTCPELPLKAQARIRHRQPLANCLVTKTEHGYSIAFEQPQFAPTPGQSLVLYKDGLCLGGGVIDHSDAPIGSI